MMDHLAATSIATQHQAELRTLAAECRRPTRHLIPRWHVSWSRTKLSPVTDKGSSLVIIISASRLA